MRPASSKPTTITKSIGGGGDVLPTWTSTATVVAGAFNAPLAGVAVANEVLAAAYEQRFSVLVTGGVVAAGLVSQSLSGDYVYFGIVSATPTGGLASHSPKIT